MDTWSLRCSNYGAVLTFEYLVSAFFLRNNALIVGITFFIIILKQHFCLSILSIKHHDTLSQVPQLPVASGLGTWPYGKKHEQIAYSQARTRCHQYNHSLGSLCKLQRLYALVLELGISSVELRTYFLTEHIVLLPQLFLVHPVLALIFPFSKDPPKYQIGDFGKTWEWQWAAVSHGEWVTRNCL